jgi:hypothetical protein
MEQNGTEWNRKSKKKAFFGGKAAKIKFPSPKKEKKNAKAGLLVNLFLSLEKKQV